MNSDFVKVSHHGSKHSSDYDLWQEILRPGACVAISAGNHGNNYNHPHLETLEDLKKLCGEDFKIKLYCTNLSPTCREKFGEKSGMNLQMAEEAYEGLKGKAFKKNPKSQITNTK